MIKKQKIVWVTADYFIDCDLQPKIMQHIVQDFEISWIVLRPNRNARFGLDELKTMESIQELSIETLQSKVRQRDPRRLLYYMNLVKRIRVLQPDLIYLNLSPDPYLLPLLNFLPKENTIFCAHYVLVNDGFQFEKLTRIVTALTFSRMSHVALFSSGERMTFQRLYRNAITYLIPLALKSFGESKATKSTDVITFLSFGVINYSKNLELLIDAACNLFEKGFRNFRVSINGSCKNWEFYESKIRHPQIFDCNIKVIDNNDISDIFTRAHYFVQPYRIVSQSGAVKIALYYGLPIIASDLQGFDDDVVIGKSGFRFKTEDVKDLENIMADTILNHHQRYAQLVCSVKSFVEKKFSYQVVASNYTKMFFDVLERSTKKIRL